MGNNRRNHFREGSAEWFASLLADDEGRRRFDRNLLQGDTWTGQYQRAKSLIARLRDKWQIQVVTLAEYFSDLYNGRSDVWDDRYGVFPTVSPSRYLRDRIDEVGFEDISWASDERRARALGLEQNQILRVPRAFSRFVGQEWWQVEFYIALSAMADEGESKNAILAFIGPPGSAKSQLVEDIKLLYEAGPGNFGVWGCPFRHPPFYWIPRHLRSDFRETFAKRGVKLWLDDRDDICPLCHFRLTNPERMHDEYLPPDLALLWGSDGIPLGMQEAFPVERYRYSQRAGRGIATVPITDPNNQDAKHYTGIRDIGKLPMYRSVNDPRVYSYGKIAEASGGMIDQPEGFKVISEILRIYFTLLTEHYAPGPGTSGIITTRLLTIFHSNEAEFKNFQDNPENEAFLALRRVIPIRARHNLRLTEEVGLYRKHISVYFSERSHTDPNIPEAIADFAIATRLNPESIVATIEQKIVAYDQGEAARKSGEKFQVQDFFFDKQEERLAARDGMLTPSLSVSTGFKLVEFAIKKRELLLDADDPNSWTEYEHHCETFFDFYSRDMRELIAVAEYAQNVTLSDEEARHWRGLADKALERQLDKIEQEIDAVLRDLFAERLGELYQRTRSQARELTEAFLEYRNFDKIKRDFPLLRQLFFYNKKGMNWDERHNGPNFWKDWHEDVTTAEKNGENVSERDKDKEVRDLIFLYLKKSPEELLEVLLFPIARISEDSPIRNKYLQLIQAMKERYGYCNKCADRARTLVARQKWQLKAVAAPRK